MSDLPSVKKTKGATAEGAVVLRQIVADDPRNVEAATAEELAQLEQHTSDQIPLNPSSVTAPNEAHCARRGN
jgi:hypothetical protein